MGTSVHPCHPLRLVSTTHGDANVKYPSPNNHFHRYKTQETRKAAILESANGKQVLLHVGQRTFPDDDRHRAIMEANGCSQKEIERLTNLPRGFSRGQVVAILDIGETRLLSHKERVEPANERAATCSAVDSGAYFTTIKSARCGIHYDSTTIILAKT